MSANEERAVLLLEDGTCLYGQSKGKKGTVTGEICFNTGMTGYQEIFTDPSYYNQIMVMTNVHIGNYGVNKDEQESDSVKISGLVCHNFTTGYSRQVADQSLQQYFEQNDLVAIADVDTRFLVKHIRDKGAMNAIITSENKTIPELKRELEEVPSMSGLELSTKVTTQQSFTLGNPSATYKVAVLDLGIKSTILHKLVNKGCYLKVFPAKTDFKSIEEWQPDGYFVSNGPGDPAAVSYAISTVKRMVSTEKPFFGICLGHQLFAIAQGLNTFKMHTGHRGINHPVKNLKTGICEVTSQNHGFSVDPDSIQQNPDMEITHLNLNDNSIEGLASKTKKAFSVQYHPEASPGPHDARYLFNSFLNMLAS